MSIVLNFSTPVVFGSNKSFKESFLEMADGYFSLAGKRAFVISKEALKDKSYDVALQDLDEAFFLRFIISTIKIISYFTLILPALIFTAKWILRSEYIFHLKKVNVIYAFGDVHGQLEGFKENLLAAEIIDSEGNWKKGCTSIAVQMGDVIDRGPKSIESYQYLDKLQLQASANGGTVIRLLGNHELFLLQKNYYCVLRSGLSLEECEILRNKIIQDIKTGKIKLAWTDKNRLFSHAGMRTSIRNQIKAEIRAKTGKPVDAITLVDIVDYLNNLLIEAVTENKLSHILSAILPRANRFSHAIFQVGKARGGSAEVGGILWEDGAALFHSAHARDLPQVVAHTPPRPGESLIRITDSKRLINVDAGLCAGNRAFIKIQGAKISLFAKTKLFGVLWTIWSEKKLSYSYLKVSC
jgi:hypothetical protein